MILQQDRLLNITLPTNLIIVGERYSGKKTIAKTIAPDFIWVEGKVENIRELSGGNYVFADVDDWSPACYSAMLKLLEENEHHIIILCRNIQNLPNSILSRCVVEHIDPYQNVGNYCDNIGQLQYYSEEMLRAVDNMEYNDKFDLDVYFTVLCNRLLEKLKNGENVRRAFLISSKYNALKSLKSLNKKQFISNWQFDILRLTETWRKL